VDANLGHGSPERPARREVNPQCGPGVSPSRREQDAPHRPHHLTDGGIRRQRTIGRRDRRNNRGGTGQIEDRNRRGRGETEVRSVDPGIAAVESRLNPSADGRAAAAIGEIGLKDRGRENAVGDRHVTDGHVRVRSGDADIRDNHFVPINDTNGSLDSSGRSQHGQRGRAA
jgi:hypothetical protein